MNAPRHLLVRASAGTGKTHALTSRYLALLLGGADPAVVLATTFTRKAAHEIQGRVLERLAQAAGGGEALDRLSASVEREVTAPECLDLLARLLRGIDRIRIGTIDAFLVKLARLFALDLGLPADWRIADASESDHLRSEAVGEAVAGAAKLELLDLLRDFQRQSIGQSAHEELLRFVAEGRQALLESGPGAWDRIRPLPDALPEDLATAVAALPGFLVPRTKSGGEKVHWANAKRKLVECAERGAWADLLAVGIVKSVCAGKADFDRSPIEPAHLEVLRPLVEHARHLATETLARQNRASRALLERNERSYRALGRGLLGFEDLPDALRALGSSVDGPLDPHDIAHRLDARIDHLLLDEFQDTSPAQWRVLRPIADAILGDADGRRSFFGVGDVKQSIYGWRSAEPRLLRDFAKQRKKLETETLKTSYRSSRAVLGTVNEVFARLDENPAFTDDRGEERTEALAAAREFQEGFDRHEPAPRAGGDRPGAVTVLRARAAAEGQAAEAPVLVLAVDLVRGILAEAPAASVGILLRRRRWIPELIAKLREAGIPASDEGGNPLTDSIAVLHALSLLHLADHPGDLAAAFHVATSPLGPKVGLEPGTFRERAAAVARGVRRSLAELGFGAWLASIRPAGASEPSEGGGYGSWDAGRFGQLVDLAFAWEGRAGSRPRAFVEHVRKTKVEDPSAEQVRVMTVHGAKGLEFDAVILPELDVPLVRNERRLLTLRPDPEGEIEVVTHRLPKEIRAAHAELERVHQDVARRRIVEELCVLYVAMTRAIHRLDLIVRAREEEGGGLTFATILRGALGFDAAGEEGIAWEHGERTEPWFREEVARAPGTSVDPRGSAEPRVKRPLRLAPSRRPRSLPALSPSRADDVGPAQASNLLRPREVMTARGRLLHRLLQELEWIETFDRSDEDLLAIGRGIESDTDVLRAALADFRAALERPGTRQALSRPPGELELWRERPFSIRMAGPDGREALWSGAFDRVVLFRKAGELVSADLLDFKSDRVDASTVGNRAESYRAQMEAYRRALARITGLEETRIRARLLFLSLDALLFPGGFASPW